ncbi:hypothetical protein Dimus_026810, partial [Dionaea muscipula]
MDLGPNYHPAHLRAVTFPLGARGSRQEELGRVVDIRRKGAQPYENLDLGMRGVDPHDRPLKMHGACMADLLDDLGECMHGRPTRPGLGGACM